MWGVPEDHGGSYFVFDKVSVYATCSYGLSSTFTRPTLSEAARPPGPIPLRV